MDYDEAIKKRNQTVYVPNWFSVDIKTGVSGNLGNGFILLMTKKGLNICGKRDIWRLGSDGGLKISMRLDSLRKDQCKLCLQIFFHEAHYVTHRDKFLAIRIVFQFITFFNIIPNKAPSNLLSRALFPLKWLRSRRFRHVECIGYYCETGWRCVTGAKPFCFRSSLLRLYL